MKARILYTVGLLALLLSLVGCKSCEPEPYEKLPLLDSSVPWEVSSLPYRDPMTISTTRLENRELEIYDNYWNYNQHYGIIFPGMYSSLERDTPDRFSGGGDSALFTGFALAAFCYRGSVTGDFYPARETLKGIYWLTHAAGNGVICRAVIPKHLAWKWNYPEAWRSRITSGFSREGPEIVTDNWTFPKSIYYTRATRDQLTGLIYGLAVAWKYLEKPEDKLVINKIVLDLYKHLKKHSWKIRDEKGKNDTFADKVDGLLKLQFCALLKQVSKNRFPDIYEESNSYYLENYSLSSVADIANIFNNYSQYYAHNLRAARALTIWTLEDNKNRKKEAADYIVNNIWKYTKKHKNAWFAAIVYYVNNNLEAKKSYYYSIKSQSLKPIRGYGSPYAEQRREPTWYQVLNGCADNFVIDPHLRKMTNYFIWTKKPWDTGHRDPNGYLNETGLDFLLPYWLIISKESQ